MVSMDVRSIVDRMYNWKMKSAYEQAASVPEISKEVLDLLREMAIKFGNCGWQEGKIFNELRETNHKIADLLGLIWDDRIDYWVEKGQENIGKEREV